MRVVSVLLLLMSASVMQGCVPVVAVGIGTGVVMAQDRRTTGSFVDDQGIEFKAQERVARSYQQNTHINITSFNRKVLISGEVPTEQIKKDVGQIVAGVENVRMVNNELKVAAPSSLASRSSDALVTSNVKVRLVQDNRVRADRVKVVTENGTVFLMGMVNRSEADVATDVARTTSGVQRVVKLFEYVD